MAEDVRIEAAARAWIGERGDGTHPWDDNPVAGDVDEFRKHALGRMAKALAAADAVPVPPLPYEDLDAIEKHALAFRFNSDPTGRLSGHIQALVAEVRRARAGSVSEYQQISANDLAWLLDAAERSLLDGATDHVSDFWLRLAEKITTPVWVRKEDAQ